MFQEKRYVYEVYRQRSFSRAAKALYISQPSLSLMVRKAEERIGSPLFDRSTSPIGLTEAGRMYIRAVEQVMEIENSFQEYLDDAENCLTGVLSLGGTTFFASYIFPPLISAFSASYPGVEIRLHEAHTSVLMRDLQEGTLDLIAENGAFDPMVYEARTYLNEEMLLAVPINLPVNEGLRDYCLTAAQIAAGTPLEQVRPVPLERFSGERFLLLKEGNDTRIRADRLCAQARFRPQVSLLLDQQLAAYNLAAYGLGVAFISDTLARRAQPDGRLLFYRLDGPAARRSVRFFYKRTRFLTSPMRAFLALLPPENASSANAM